MTFPPPHNRLDFCAFSAAGSQSTCAASTGCGQVSRMARSLPHSAEWPAPEPNREPVPLRRRAEHELIANSVHATCGQHAADSDVQPGSCHLSISRLGTPARVTAEAEGRGRGHVPTPTVAHAPSVGNCATAMCYCHVLLPCATAVCYCVCYWRVLLRVLLLCAAALLL